MADNQNKDYEQQREEEVLKDTETERESAVEEEMTAEELEELLTAKILDPELELEQEMQNQLLYLLSKNPEMAKTEQFYKMAQESGMAVAKKAEMMEAIRTLVESMKELFPGYQNMNWQMILEDAGTVHEFTKVLKTDIRVTEFMNGIWVKEAEEKLFRRAEREDLSGICDFDRLTIENDGEEFRIQYYCTGMFAERPTLLIRNKAESEDQTFSVILHMNGRSEAAGGRMQYSGSCEALENGDYEIKLMTNLKKIDESGRIVCE